MAAKLTGSDHGVKAQGDGWVLTVALVEGANLASTSPTEVPDPYVVFTCNGKSRTSSVKLRARDPQWNGISSLFLVYFYYAVSLFGPHLVEESSLKFIQRFLSLMP